MYKVVLYGLVGLVIIALALSALGVLSYASFGVLLMMLLLLSVVTFSSNQILARLYGVVPNLESSAITALILFFVLGAPTRTSEWVGIALAGVIAIASKYIITWHSAHIFNPAAFGVIAVSLLGVGGGSWWIANAALFIPTLIVGYLILYKLRRFELFFAFAVPALIVILLTLLPGLPIFEAVITAFTLYPLLFLGTVMLTEPSTMPTGRYERIVFGILVGLLFAYTFDLGFIASSPHLALLVGNLFAFLVTMRVSAKLKLVEINQLTPTTYSYSFKPEIPFKYKSGQYMEFTLPKVQIDSRGNRRSFSIASAPADELINIGVKFYQPSSQFKTALQSLKIGDEIIGNHVAGEFILQKDTSRSLVFIAGGIGITPFISMIRDMQHTKIIRSIDLYYFVSDKTEVAYEDILKTASNNGVTVHIRIGRDAQLTNEEIASHPEADFYLSGPPGLVNVYKSQLKLNGVKSIHTDYFSGY
jgi:ferredoxin-NADP reductase